MEPRKILYTYIISLILVIGSISNIYGQETPHKSTKSDPNTPIFEIKNDLGQTVFAVYPGGVKIFVDDQQLKATGGGFTVGRIGTEKVTGNEIFSVNPNDVRVYIDETTGLKATGGGFTVGRIGTEKATANDYFSVQPNDVRVILNTTPGLKATGGGFTVGRIGTEKATGEENFLSVTPDSTRVHVSETSTSGFSVGKLGVEGTENFLDLTPENYFIGHRSGKNTTGLYNLFLGYESGLTNTLGRENTFIGYKSGHSNIDGRHNVYLGYESGLSNSNGSLNVFIGYQTGRSSNTSAHDNVYIGFGTGRDKPEGSGNVMLGKYTGLNTGVGDYNVIIGNYAGYAFDYTPGADDISNNVIIGRRAANDGIGANNVIIGAFSGYNMHPVNSTGNVFLGNYAGYNELGSNRLYIDNSTIATPLIYGEFDNDLMKINGRFHVEDNLISTWVAEFFNDGNADTRLGIKVQAGTDDASGTNYMMGFYDGNNTYEGAITLTNGTVSIVQASDRRLKENIVNTNVNALNIINGLRVVDFNFIKTKSITHTGYIAQEALTVFPYMVDYNKMHDIYGISTSKLIPVLHKAIQEQQKQIEDLKEKNNILSQQVSEFDLLKAEMIELKAMVKEIAGTTKESKSESAK